MFYKNLLSLIIFVGLTSSFVPMQAHSEYIVRIEGCDNFSKALIRFQLCLISGFVLNRIIAAAVAPNDELALKAAQEIGWILGLGIAITDASINYESMKEMRFIGKILLGTGLFYSFVPGTFVPSK